MKTTQWIDTMHFIFLFGVFIILQCNECTSTKIVTLIYDKVNTTTYDIDRYSASIKNISTDFYNDRLDLHFKIIFPDKSYIVEIVNGTTTYNDVHHIKGQTTLKSTLTQLQDSPQNSAICVITNVTKPQDWFLIDNVLEEIQMKRTEVSFVLERSNSSQVESLQEYRLITSISNGVILPKFFEFNQRSESVYLWLRYLPWKVFMHISQPEERFDSSIDTLTGEPVVYVSDSFDYNENKIMSTDINLQQIGYTHTEDGKSILEDLSTRMAEFDHQGKQNPKHPSFYNYHLISKSRFNIEYGFSVSPVSSLNETRRRPIKRKSNRLYVTSSSKIFHNVTCGSFTLLFLNGTNLQQDIPLHQVAKTDLFQGLFQPPNEEYFFIEVSCEVIELVSHVEKPYLELHRTTRTSLTAMNAMDAKVNFLFIL
ncbi:uncharacterized protein LOC135834372 [Planococcus citri]|uniref:uncharacterized protein LOC135834372 n=1 Tax=Planococcus citri TaxID=170843 RepID=UPI0031F7D40D